MEIIVVIVGAMISFIGLIITKEQKISEFRQKWIDYIRDDISNLMGYLTQFSVSFELATQGDMNNTKGKIFIKENILTISKIETLMKRITLRLNSSKDKLLIDTLEEIEKVIITPGRMYEDGCLENEMKKLSKQSHKLLKTEWERVKKGEPIFKITKVVVFCVSLLMIVTYFFNSWCFN